MNEDTPPDWARNIGRVYARFGEQRSPPGYFRKPAIDAFLEGYDAVLAEAAEERRIEQTHAKG